MITATILTTFQTHSLIVQYEKAFEDEKLTREIIHQLETKKHRTPKETAYLGAFSMLMANHIASPFSKFAYFQEGKTFLSKAIEQAPNTLEIRYLRFINQVETPRILGYKTNIAEDKKFILEHIGALKGTIEHKQITKYLHLCEELTIEEKKQLANDR